MENKMNIEKISSQMVELITVRFDENTACDFMRINGIWFFGTDDGYQLQDDNYVFDLDMLEATYQNIRPDVV